MRLIWYDRLFLEPSDAYVELLCGSSRAMVKEGQAERRAGRCGSGERMCLCLK